jgi:hypothetical protein
MLLNSWLQQVLVNLHHASMIDCWVSHVVWCRGAARGALCSVWILIPGSVMAWCTAAPSRQMPPCAYVNHLPQGLVLSWVCPGFCATHNALLLGQPAVHACVSLHAGVGCLRMLSARQRVLHTFQSTYEGDCHHTSTSGMTSLLSTTWFAVV